MNKKKFYLSFEEQNGILIIYISSLQPNINFMLQKGDNPSWVFVSSVNYNKLIKKINIDQKIFDDLLKMDIFDRYKINNHNNIYQLFESWNLINLIGEQLI
jgi:hypothetical protein